jgi:sigma-B regulation protein RsbU (phosphoserine phosphatase)
MVYAGFIQEEAEQLKLKHDIAIAREVQEKLFPQKKPPVGTLSYLGACRPAHAVGGDCYDFLDLGGGRVGLALGDVSGKGVSAALLMASLQAMLRIHADVHGAEVHRIAWDINRLLCEITDANRFITFFYGVFDAATTSLAYVNAGHNPPLLLRPVGGMSVGAQALRAAGADLEYQVFKLGPTGMVLGVFKDAEFSKVRVRLRRGDLLVVYTDGITEAMNADGEEYGERRLETLLQSVAHLSVAEVRDAVFNDVESFIGEAPQTDDITLVVAKVM